MVRLAHAVGFIFSLQVPRQTMITTTGILRNMLPFGLHLLDNWSKVPSITDLLRHRCFSNNPVIPIAITYVRRKTPRRWCHSWWIRILRSKWSRCRCTTDTTLSLIVGAMETLEGWNTTCVWNPCCHDGIINPLIQIITKGGCTHSIGGGGIPLLIVPPMHLHIEVMNRLDDTKTAPPKLREPTLEG